MIESYTFSEHLHRYSVWTAARAAQRNFTTTSNIKEALEQVKLKETLAILAKMNNLNTEKYDAFHREVAKKLMAILSQKVDNATYGRVAKIIGIYVKTSYVIPNPSLTLSHVAHPPIDRILLQKLSRLKDGTFRHLRKKNWTELDEVDYFHLISELRPLVGTHPFWKLETYWEAQ